MTLRSYNSSKSAIEVPAAHDVFHGLRRIYLMQPSEERERTDRAIQEAGIYLAVFVARKHARGLLKGYEDCARQVPCHSEKEVARREK